MLRRILSFELTVAEWATLAVVLAAPYLAAGVVWTIGHGDRFTGLGGFDLAAAILGAVVSWPALLAPTACLT